MQIFPIYPTAGFPIINILHRRSCSYQGICKTERTLFGLHRLDLYRVKSIHHSDWVENLEVLNPFLGICFFGLQFIVSQLERFTRFFFRSSYSLFPSSVHPRYCSIWCGYKPLNSHGLWASQSTPVSHQRSSGQSASPRAGTFDVHLFVSRRRSQESLPFIRMS